MSLTFEELAESGRRWNEMDKRLTKLIGFNPATSNHYGQIQLYNYRIDSKTSDEQILELRSKYVKWKTEILTIFKNNNVILKDEQFNKLFSVDCMFGTITFLGEQLDLTKDMNFYQKLIEKHINKATNTRNNKKY